MTDRLSDGYQPDFDIDLRLGQQAELFVKDITDSFANGQVEVKRDAKAATTGNIYIETQCRGRDGVWRPSGLSTTKAGMLAYVLENEVMVVAPTANFREVVEWAQAHKLAAECTRGSNPTKGVRIPLVVLLRELTTKRGEAAA